MQNFENKPIPKNELPANFRKIKARALVIRIVKALLTGLAIALLAIGTLMLLNRFEVIRLENTVSILIGVGLAILVSCGMYFLLLKSDKAIAKKLDSEYRLSEKIQTMLAFKDDPSPMAKLQRESANQALETVKESVLGLNRLWIYILCFVLATTAFVLSLFFYPRPVENEGEDEVVEVPFAVTENQLKLLQDTIDNVASSEMQSPYKENAVAILEALKTDIQTADTVSKKDALVKNAMDELLLQADQSSNALELIEAIWGVNSVESRALATALNYYEWPKDKDDAYAKYVANLTDYRTSFIHKDASDSVNDELLETITQETVALLTSAGNGITLALENSKVSPDDPLYVVLFRLANANETNDDGTRVYGLYVLATYLSENGYAKVQRELDATISAINGEIYTELYQNKTNIETCETAVTRIAAIFGVKAPKFERPNLENTAPDAGDDSIGGAEGGIGGGPSYGSDDKVYDPFTNKYVEYGTILDKYYQIMFANLQGGEYTDEEKKALEKYFDILYGGFEDENK